jgi:hypothetical protein
VSPVEQELLTLSEHLRVLSYFSRIHVRPKDQKNRQRKDQTNRQHKDQKNRQHKEQTTQRPKGKEHKDKLLHKQTDNLAT